VENLYDKDHVKVRYLVGSLVTIPNDKLPPGFETMTIKEVWAWIQEYWQTLSAEDLRAAIIPEFTEDVLPAMVEVYEAERGDYRQIIKTNEWDGYWHHERINDLTEETEEVLDSPWKEVEV
jgi:hypothetical protein